MVRIGVIGYGYWGPNIVRNFQNIENTRVEMVCDKNPESLRKVTEIYPDIKITNSYEDLLTNSKIDAVAIVTPVSTHYDLSMKALLHGKHIFVEKPFTATTEQAQILLETAEKQNCKIMVDHTFLFTGAVKKIKELIDSNELGQVYYYDSVRVNLGLFQHDVNVIWDLAPHDFSIMNYVLRDKPIALSAWGRSHINDFEDIAYVTVYFTNNLIAHFSVNWLSPVKVRTTLIGGERKMLVWNDLNADEKIKIYDKGVEIQNRQNIYDLLVSYRSGDMFAPRIESIEALKIECEQFVKSIMGKAQILSDGYIGLEVVRMLEACDESLRNKGQLVDLKGNLNKDDLVELAKIEAPEVNDGL